MWHCEIAWNLRWRRIQIWIWIFGFTTLGGSLVVFDMFLILLPSWYNVYWIILYLHICDIYFKQMYLQNTYTHFTFFLPFCLHNVRTSFVSLNGERRQDTTSSFSLWVFAAAKWLRHYQQRRADFGVGFGLFGAIPHWCLDENNVSLKPARFLHILYKAGFLYSTFLYWDLYMYYRYLWIVGILDDIVTTISCKVVL